MHIGKATPFEMALRNGQDYPKIKMRPRATPPPTISPDMRLQSSLLMSAEPATACPCMVARRAIVVFACVVVPPTHKTRNEMMNEGTHGVALLDSFVIDFPTYLGTLTLRGHD